MAPVFVQKMAHKITQGPTIRDDLREGGGRIVTEASEQGGEGGIVPGGGSHADQIGCRPAGCRLTYGGDPVILGFRAPGIGDGKATVGEHAADFLRGVPNSKPGVGAAPEGPAASVHLKLEHAARLECAGSLAHVAGDGAFGRDVLEDGEGVDEVERGIRDHIQAAMRDMQGYPREVGKQGAALLNHGGGDVHADDPIGPGGERTKQAADAAADFQYRGAAVEFETVEDQSVEVRGARGPELGVAAGIATADVALRIGLGALVPFALHASGRMQPPADKPAPETGAADG